MSERNQHDIITKKVLSQKTYAVDFIKNTLPGKLTSKLDLKRLKIEKGSFVDEKNKERFTDILYSIPTKKSKKQVGVFCLVEHKSYPDKNIHSQLFSYLAGIYTTYRFSVIPMVLYHGKKTWDIPLNLASSLNIPDELRDELMRYIPEFQYELLDLRSENISIDYFSLALQAFLKTLQDIWFLSSRSKLEALFKNYFAPVYKGNARTGGTAVSEKMLDDLFDYIMRSIGKLDVQFIVDIAVKHISQDAGGKMVTIADKLIAKGKAEGMEKGMEKGKAERSQEVALNLLRQGIPIKVISKSTDLSPEEIEKLKS